jgi:hypothetical protein
MFVILVYDIGEKRVQNVHKVCKKYLTNNGGKSLKVDKRDKGINRREPRIRFDIQV